MEQESSIRRSFHYLKTNCFKLVQIWC